LLLHSLEKLKLVAPLQTQDHSLERLGTLDLLIFHIKVMVMLMISSIGGSSQETMLPMILLFFGSLVDQDAHLKLLFSTRTDLGLLNQMERLSRKTHTHGTPMQIYFTSINQLEQDSHTPTHFI
jgi:hypothetical protein